MVKPNLALKLDTPSARLLAPRYVFAKVELVPVGAWEPAHVVIYQEGSSITIDLR